MIDAMEYGLEGLTFHLGIHRKYVDIRALGRVGNLTTRGTSRIFRYSCHVSSEENRNQAGRQLLKP